MKAGSSRPLLACAAWFLCAGSLDILYGPTLRSHFELASRPGVLDDDARALVYPYYRFNGASQFAADDAASYMLAVTPAGVRALYATLAAWVDPMVFTTIAAYGLLLVTVASCAAAASRLGGVTSAWTTVVLLLGSGHALSRMTDALPRAYCFPVLALSMLALVEGRPLAMASLVVVGALLYPASGVVAGLALAIFLLLLPARHRGAAAEWTLRRRLAVLAAALVAALAWLPVALRSRSYGPLIVPSQFAIFPEAGPGGRLNSRDDRPRGQGIAVELRRATERSVSGSGLPLVPALHGWYERVGSERWIVLVGLAVAGGIALGRRRPETWRAAVVPAAAAVLYFVAVQVFPYLYFPELYLGYPLPVALAVLLPAGTRALIEEDARAIGGSWLPARLRGWMGAAGVLVLALETHQPQHAEYVLSMRRRAQAVFTAYFATTPEPILELRDRYGVTHLLIDQGVLERPPRYFTPFDDDVERAMAAAKGKTFEVLRQAATAATYRDSRYLLLDLSRIDAPAQRVGGGGAAAGGGGGIAGFAVPRFCANNHSHTAGSS